ncbi:Signal transduction histidine-protein kinase/phosphatase MprB [Fundidesulfovibrio magnetotacticus]|uniref:histidine kinase n=1 Tax=Fundidesulfovibrio magnetotacticus TaxID=2730080 RepID=A0A6V8LZY5_9BACT|nr:HAMP domain-containing sensor histidine kinase [Fundidesulfovibrio magnetotacticus]GFK95579.1 Signal transduction histidine-protein kinase/phosphatase MprB [Fundidesulfovibrio magnetotacticus]
MIRPKLLKTFSFRLALWYVALFAGSATVVFAFIWWAAVTFMVGQTDDSIESEIWNLAEQYDERGLAALSMQISTRQRSEGSRSNIYLLADRDLHYLAGNMRQWPKGVTPRGFPEWHTIRVTSELDGRSTDARVRVITLMGKVHLLVGRELSDVLRARAIMASAMAVGLLVTVVMGLVWGNVMTRKLLERLEAINSASQEIMGGALSRRIPVSGAGDEFDRLAANLNDMLDRIGELLDTVRQVSDNIAHDLRSPLTRLRSRLELALLEKPDPGTQRHAMEEAIAQAESIIATFNALLTIARAESAAAKAETQDIDLSALVRDAAELYEPLGEDKGLEMRVEVADALTLTGNRHLLSQAVANLLDNAVKYTPEGGTILVRAARMGDGAIALRVADTGPGIPEEERANVLRRFYRLDQSRGTPGSGLGLSLVAAVARLHGARMELSDAGPGLAVELRFPGRG